MITILKGDTSADISVVLAEGFDYSASTVVVEYQGARRSFGDCRAGAVLTFRFSAEETSPMAFGAHPVSARIVRHDGSIVSVPTSATAIRVTDDPREVHVDGVIAVDVKGGLFGIEDLPERWTEEDVVAKLREILRRGGAVLCALFLAIPCFGASVSTAPKGKIYNDAPVVTNVTFDGLATTNDVCNIVTNEVEYSEWMCVPSEVNGEPIRIVYTPGGEYGNWTPMTNGVAVGRENGAPDATEIVWPFNDASWGFGLATQDIVAVRRPFRRNALGLAMLKDLEPLPTYKDVTNVARDVSNSFWDDKNQVLWRMEFRDGEPMFVPVTNENVKATGGVE